MKFNLNPGESILYEQVLFYRPANGGKYNGKLTVTDSRLFYDAKYDVSFKGMVSEALFIKWGSEGYLEIPKSDITGVEVQKKLLSKQCILKMSDGSTMVFDAGALGVDKLADMIRQGSAASA